MGIFNRKKKITGDMKLFEAHIYPIYKDLYRFVYSILRNPVLAEDAMQNALEKAYKSFINIEKQSSFKSWMFTIAKNEAISIIRQYQRESCMDISEQEVLFQEKEFLPEELILQEEVREQLIDIINTLKPEYKDLIILRYYGELTLDEIAAVLNINVNTVKTRHRRAKEKIRLALKENTSLQNTTSNHLIDGGGVNV